MEGKINKNSWIIKSNKFKTKNKVGLPALHFIFQFLSNVSIDRFGLDASVLLQYGFGRCLPGEVQPLLVWMSLQDQDYPYAVIMMLFNLLLYRGLAFWLMVIKYNPKQNRRRRVLRIGTYLRNLPKPSKLFWLLDFVCQTFFFDFADFNEFKFPELGKSSGSVQSLLPPLLMSISTFFFRVKGSWL